MKKYFLHDGVSQQGPYDLQQLKSQLINIDTPVWFDTLKDWTPAGQIEELNVLFISAPPPFRTTTSQSQPTPPPQYDPFQPEKKSKRKPLLIGGSLVGATAVILLIYSLNKSEAASPDNFISSQAAHDWVETVGPDAKRLQELEAKEARRQAINEERTKKNMEYRNKWKKYIVRNNSSYQISVLGGIEGLEVSASNSTDKLIDEVIVTIDYYKANGGLYTSKEVSLTNIAPNSSAAANVENTSRGTRLEARITKITSRALHFCYNAEYDGNFNTGVSGNENDPWFCK